MGSARRSLVHSVVKTRRWGAGNHCLLAGLGLVTTVVPSWATPQATARPLSPPALVARSLAKLEHTQGVHIRFYWDLHLQSQASGGVLWHHLRLRGISDYAHRPGFHEVSWVWLSQTGTPHRLFFHIVRLGQRMAVQPRRGGSWACFSGQGGGHGPFVDEAPGPEPMLVLSSPGTYRHATLAGRLLSHRRWLLRMRAVARIRTALAPGRVRVVVEYLIGAIDERLYMAKARLWLTGPHEKLRGWLAMTMSRYGKSFRSRLPTMCN